MKKSQKTVFSCQSCGYQAPKWMGKCPDCDTWDSFVEERPVAVSKPGGSMTRPGGQSGPVSIDSIELDTEHRLHTEIREFDRVLGGGLVPGTLVLIGGDPGIGDGSDPYPRSACPLRRHPVPEPGEGDAETVESRPHVRGRARSVCGDAVHQTGHDSAKHARTVARHRSGRSTPACYDAD